MGTKILLVDMDAIVADLAGRWYDLYNRVYQPEIPLTMDRVTQWDVGKAIGDPRIYGLLKTAGLYRDLDVFPGAQKALKALKKLKLPNGEPAYDINFLTAAISAPHILTDKSEWLADRFPFIGPKNHMYVYKKEMVRGHYLLDDAPKNLLKWKAANPEGKTLTIHYPYNEGVAADFTAIDYKDMAFAWEQLHAYLVVEATASVDPSQSLSQALGPVLTPQA